MTINTQKINNIIDAFVIIGGLTFKLSLLIEFISAPLSINRFLLIFAILFIFHLYRFPNGLMNTFLFIKENSLLIFFLSIYIIDFFIQFLFFEKWELALFNFSTVFLYFSYLYNVFLHNGNNLDKIIKPYLVYSIWNGVTILLLVFLVLLGAPWEMNDITNKYELFSGHSEWTMKSYFPYYLSVAANYHPTIGFPVFSGLSHEPHVIMYILMPAFFLLLSKMLKMSNKIILLFTIIVINIDTTSTTAIASSFICIILELYYYFVKKKKLLAGILGLLLCFVAGYIVLKHFGFVWNYITDEKIGSNSQDASSNMLSYLLSDILIGTGNCPSERAIDLKGSSAGIVGILDIILYLCVLYKSLMLVLHNERHCHYIGLAAFYFLLHSLKVSYMIFGYCYFAFILFIVVTEYKKMKTVKNKMLGE